MITNYYYDEQLKSYLKQFAAIFHGLGVMTGIGECGTPEGITVPLTYAHKDRVVAAISAGNTSNRVFSLPTMSFHLAGITPANDRRKAPGIVDQRVTMRAGGVFPEDLVVVKRVLPVPYDATIELSIYASNSDQMFQIFEQIAVLFNPDIQIQKNDSPHDWTRISRVELQDIAKEDNIPSGTDRRIILWTFTFLMPIYIGIPMGVKDDLVRKIIIQIGSSDSLSLIEVNENGELQPFGEPLAKIEITERDPEGLVPIQPVQLP